MLMVYICELPLSEVTSILKVLSPTDKFCLPVPFTLQLLPLQVASMLIVSISFLTIAS